MSEEFYTACQRLLIATANGVYQGIVVAALTGLFLRLFARTNAATRHAVWFGALLLVTALIPAHLLLSRWSHSEIPPTAGLPDTSLAAFAAPPTDSPSIVASPNADFDVLTSPSDTEYAASTDATLSLSSHQPNQVATRGDNDSKNRSDAAVTGKAWQRFTPALFRPSSWNLQTAISLPHSICFGLVSAWLLLASVRGGLIARRLGEVRRVKKSSTAPSVGLQAVFDRLRASLAARRNVRLKISTTHRAAVLLGFIHPAVLLPAEMDNQDANEDEVEHVLRHELAHVARNDDWGNLTQQVIQAALFFHPAVWWISGKLSLEREIACDDHVLEASGRPRAYALTLANVASRMNQCRHLLAPGVSNNNSQLQQRITMILNTQRDRSPRLARSRVGLFTTATAIVAVLAINAGPRLVLAQTPAPGPAPSALPSDSIAAAPQQDALVAESLPASQPSDLLGSESGPRPKPPVSADDFGQLSVPQPNALLAPAAPGLPATPAMPPMAAADPAPDVSPVPPAAPARPGKRRLSVEERLDRIERMLGDLQARDGFKGRHRSSDADSVSVGQNRANGPFAMTVNPNFDFQFKTNFDFQIKIAAQEAKRAAEDAQRAAEQGQREAEKAMRDIARLKNRDLERLQDDLRDAEAEGPVRALEALRTARESLQQQMQSIERQIKALEQDQKHKKDGQHGRDGKPDDDQKPEQPSAEKS